MNPRKRPVPPPDGTTYTFAVIDGPNELYPPGTPMPPPVEFIDDRPDPDDPNDPRYTYDGIDCPNELAPPDAGPPPVTDPR